MHLLIKCLIQQKAISMLITKEIQEAMITKYVNERHSQDECIGFIDGMQAMLDLVTRLMQDKVKYENEFHNRIAEIK